MYILNENNLNLNSIFNEQTSIKTEEKSYLQIILDKSNNYLRKVFNKDNTYDEFLCKISYIKNISQTQKVIFEFSKMYYMFVKELYQKQYPHNKEIDTFLTQKNTTKKIIWGDCYNVLKHMKSESIHCMVTSPPYYNAREYSQWKNLHEYMDKMEKIITECYRVLDN